MQRRGKVGWCVMCAGCRWVSQCVHMVITALLPLVLFPLLGVCDANLISRQYYNDTIFLLLGSCFVAMALERVKHDSPVPAPTALSLRFYNHSCLSLVQHSTGTLQAEAHKRFAFSVVLGTGSQSPRVLLLMFMLTVCTPTCCASHTSTQLTYRLRVWQDTNKKLGRCAWLWCWLCPF